MCSFERDQRSTSFVTPDDHPVRSFDASVSDTSGEMRLASVIVAQHVEDTVCTPNETQRCSIRVAHQRHNDVFEPVRPCVASASDWLSLAMVCTAL
jgi:hypothetical protein